MLYIYIASLLSICLVWIIYPATLAIISKFKKNLIIDTNDITQKNISVIISAHNEANNLEKRCVNIFTQDYAYDIEIIIASDGSTDYTEQIIDQLKTKYTNITLIDIQPQGGRSNAHNCAISYAKHDFLVFTDAETVFDSSCLKQLMIPFSDQQVGFVSGTLKYINQDSTFVSQSAGIYWHFEMLLRTIETKLGLYATGTGACCAVRKELYKRIPATGDVDFITPLDVVLQDKKCIHSSEAIAWDELPDSPKKEFNARVRMTSKNFKGTLSRWGFIAYFKKPAYSSAIFFHKIGRWLTPFFMLALLISTLFSLDISVFFHIFLGLQLAFYLLGLLGGVGVNFLLSRQIYSFLLANAGFFIGVLRALFGFTPRLYKPVGQQS